MENPDPMRGALAMTLEILTTEGHGELATKLREKWTEDLRLLAALAQVSDQMETSKDG